MWRPVRTNGDVVSKKIEGQSIIKRAPKQKHISTYSLPYERTLQSIPYYAQKQRQMKIKYGLYESPPNEQVADLQSESVGVQQPKQEWEQEQQEVSLRPVMVDNKFIDLNPEHYPLTEEEKVKVVQEKYFALHNYYNYIAAMKSKEDLFRMEQQQAAANMFAQLLQQQFLPKGGDYVEALDRSNENRFLPKQTIRLKGQHQSHFKPAIAPKRHKKSKGDQLAPVYHPYEQKKDKPEPFTMKQDQRQKKLLTFQERVANFFKIDT